MGNVSSAHARSYRIRNDSTCRIIVRCHNPDNFHAGWGAQVTVEPGREEEVFRDSGRSSYAEIKFIYEGEQIYSHDISLNRDLFSFGQATYITNIRAYTTTTVYDRGAGAHITLENYVASWGDIASIVNQRQQAAARRRLQERAHTLVETGQTERLAGRYAQALLILNQAIELDANNASAFFNRGDVRRLQGNLPEALADLSHSLTLNPTAEIRRLTLDSRGALYWQQGNFQQALTDLNQALELNAQDAFALGHRGRVYASQGHYDDAIRDFDAALLITPGLTWLQTSGQEAIEMRRRARIAAQIRIRLNELNTILEYEVLQAELPRTAPNDLKTSRLGLISSAQELVALGLQADSALTTTINTQIDEVFANLNALIGCNYIFAPILYFDKKPFLKLQLRSITDQ